jgi:hypothetical protein
LGVVEGCGVTFFPDLGAAPEPLEPAARGRRCEARYMWRDSTDPGIGIEIQCQARAKWRREHYPR